MWLIIIIILDGFLQMEIFEARALGNFVFESCLVYTITSVNMDRFEYFFACGL